MGRRGDMRNLIGHQPFSECPKWQNQGQGYSPPEPTFHNGGAPSLRNRPLSPWLFLPHPQSQFGAEKPGAGE